MDSRKFLLGILILTFVLIETVVCKSQRRHKLRKNDTETDASKEIRTLDKDVSVSLPGSDEVARGADVAILPTINGTHSLSDPDKKTKKAHRLKHRRPHHHKRKQHYKRIRKNKKRNEEEHQSHELQTAGIIAARTSDLEGPKQGSLPKRTRTHHHQRSDKHHQRQQRRLHRRRKFRAHKHKKLAEKHNDEANSSVDP